MFFPLKGHKQDFCFLNYCDYAIPIVETTLGSASAIALDLKTTYYGLLNDTAGSRNFSRRRESVML